MSIEKIPGIEYQQIGPIWSTNEDLPCIKDLRDQMNIGSNSIYMPQAENLIKETEPKTNYTLEN